MAKKPIQPINPELLKARQFKSDFDGGSWKPLDMGNGTWGAGWREPDNDDEEGYGIIMPFDDVGKGYEKPEDVWDFLEASFGERPIESLDQLEKYYPYYQSELNFQDDMTTQDLFGLLDLAKNNPNQFQDELGSASQELLNNPLVQQIIKKYSGKK